MLFQAIFILFFNKSIKMVPMGFLFCFPELGGKEGRASVEVWFIITLLLESVSPPPSSESLLLLSFLTLGLGFCCPFLCASTFCLVLAWLQSAGGKCKLPWDLHFIFKAHLLCAMFCLGVERIPGHVTDLVCVLLEPKVRWERKKWQYSVVWYEAYESRCNEVPILPPVWYSERSSQSPFCKSKGLFVQAREQENRDAKMEGRLERLASKILLLSILDGLKQFLLILASKNFFPYRNFTRF